MTKSRRKRGSRGQARREGAARSVLLGAALWAALGLATPDAYAAGTTAGTVISNRAEVSYTMFGAVHSGKSNPNVFAVDDKVSFTLTAADSADVTVTPGGRAFMAYILTNTGNGPHDFTLNGTVAGTPTLNPASGPAFYADAAGANPLPTDPNAGNLPYLSGLAPDAGRTVYLGITAPAHPADGQTVDYLVTAQAYQSAHLGVLNPPISSSSKAAVDASADKNAHLMTGYVVLADGHGNGGDADRDGKYAVVAKDGNGDPVGFTAISASVGVVKSAAVTDRAGGSQPVSGATIRYTLNVAAAGAGGALGVAITDPIPAGTAYTAGTLTLNGKALSDAADGDAGDVGGTSVGVVTVRLGDLTSASPVQTITFDVKID